MREAALSSTARDLSRRTYLRRLQAIQRMSSHYRFTPKPGKARLSKRGMAHPSHYTKRHTLSRRRDLFAKMLAR